MPLISVKGNKFVDPNGNPVLFRGLSISDPDKLEMQGHWNKDHFVKVKEMGISWTVWCFDPEWGPTLIRNWNYELTPSGEFAKAAMNGDIK